MASPLNRGVRHVNMDTSARPPLPRKVDMDPSARPDRPRRMSAKELEMQSVIDKHGGSYEVRRKIEAENARRENDAMSRAPKRMRAQKRDIKSITERAAETRAKQEVQAVIDKHGGPSEVRRKVEAGNAQRELDAMDREAQEKAQSGLGGWVNKLTGAIGRADDAVQGVMRHDVLRLPKDGSQPKGFLPDVREGLGLGLFPARSGSPLDTNYKIDDKLAGYQKHGSLVASRAAQAGLTAAGVGLANLTLEVAGQFGSPADSPAPSELKP